jgi:hypothetical protein
VGVGDLLFPVAIAYLSCKENRLIAGVGDLGKLAIDNEHDPHSCYRCSIAREL